MKRVLAIITAVAITAAATAALATIKNTKHDLSTTHTGQTGGSNQICIYCHTPHNAAPAIPLWNRTNPTATPFKFYSSPSMKLHRPVANTSTFESTSISLFCMSCHDGGAIGGRVLSTGGTALVGNTTGSSTMPALTGDVITTGSAGLLGTDLSNDHPVNLQMLAGTAGLYDPSANTIGNGLTTKLSLFKGTLGNNYIECGSCHAVHDASQGKFLRTSNANSKICLACHNK